MPVIGMDSGLWIPAALGNPPKEVITAHKLAMLVLVSEYCRVKMRRHVKPNEEPWSHTNQQCRDFAVLSLKLLQSPDVPLSDLLAALRPVLHPKTLDLFTEEVAIMRDSGVAGIMDYVPNLDNLLADPVAATPAVLHKSSVLGLFVRRMLLALDKLNFSALVNLHKSFRFYCDEGLRRPDGADDCAVGLARPAATQRQADLFLAQQVMLMQLSEKAALPPPQLQRRINQLLAGSRDLFEAHYLSFLNCLAVREYSGADDSLRHYFDRAVPETAKGAVEDGGATRNLRYASFNLATLHAKMGHRGEALIALREAITLAQDANDAAFLQHALSFLCRLQGSRCDPSQLRCLITRASELGLHGVASFGIQALARVEGEAGVAPSAVLELLGKSDLLNCQHAMSEPAALAERAALWAFYGFQALSQLQSHWLLHASRGDPLRASGVQPLGEASALALRNLAVAFTFHGQHQNAKNILNFGKSLFPRYSDSYKTLKLCYLVTSFNVSLYQANWPLVEKLASGIRVLDRYEGDLCRARSLLWQGHFTAALDLIDTLFKECCDTGINFVGCVPHFVGRLYHLKAELFIEASQPMLAIPVLCKGLTHAEKHHLAYIRAMLVVLMAEVQFQIGLPGHASTLLDEVVTIVLSHGSLADIGQLCLLRAKCVFSSKGVEAAGKAIQLATTSLDTYTKVQLKKGIRDAAYWLALTCHAVGLEEQRNAAAQRFRQVDEEMAEKLLYVV